jgi:tRNA (adenine-N(1)-)-methyltransferase non-catalytic subunit
VRNISFNLLITNCHFLISFAAVDTDANNELITDDQLVQPLTTDEILALKESGLHASDMIKKQIEQHANYELKTEYSKEKYKKRKEAKSVSSLSKTKKK